MYSSYTFFFRFSTVQKRGLIKRCLPAANMAGKNISWWIGAGKLPETNDDRASFILLLPDDFFFPGNIQNSRITLRRRLHETRVYSSRDESTRVSFKRRLKSIIALLPFRIETAKLIHLAPPNISHISAWWCPLNFHDTFLFLHLI